MRGWQRYLLLFLVMAAPYCAQGKQWAVVTDTANVTANVSAAELVKMFNGHTRSWPDGKPVILVLRGASSEEMQPVLHKLFDMTAPQARAFIQSHKGIVIEADSDDAVLHFVSVTRGAIGVVDLYSLTKDVRVLKVDGKLPVEQGYLLRGN